MGEGAPSLSQGKFYLSNYPQEKKGKLLNGEKRENKKMEVENMSKSVKL